MKCERCNEDVERESPLIDDLVKEYMEGMRNNSVYDFSKWLKEEKNYCLTGCSKIIIDERKDTIPTSEILDAY